MPKVIDKYKRFVADEKEMSAYNERDTFLYGQAAMLQYERAEGKKEGIEIGIQQGIEKGYKESQINIAKEKGESHVYRNEWDQAIEVAISMGRTYIIPLAEKDFDFYNAAIPEKLQRHNALFFSKEESMEAIVEKITHKMNQD